MARIVMIIMVWLLIGMPSEAGNPIKLSKSGICHDSSSPYYTRTKYFQSFSSLAACLAAGGKPHSTNSSKPLKVDSASLTEVTRYDRKQWQHWIDEDQDCQNTRAEVLILNAEHISGFKSVKQCLVVSGRWHDKYSGQWFSHAAKLDIDHIIPLAYAHQASAGKWSAEKKRAFANDPDNLIAVSARLNRQKGASGPTKWMPPAVDYQCQYLQAWQRVSAKYQLSLLDEDIRYIHLQSTALGCQSAGAGTTLRAVN